MDGRGSEDYLRKLIDSEGRQICSHHLKLYLEAEKAKSKEELLKLIKGSQELMDKIKEPELMSEDELREAIAHTIIEEIFKEREQREKVKGEIDSSRLKDFNLGEEDFDKRIS
jgi:hypothetical protein